MTGRLKVYDADTGTWKYVDGAGGTVKLLRYVPLTPNLGGINVGYAATTGPLHSPPITGIPTNAVAVAIQVIGHHTAVQPGARYEVFDYDAALSGSSLRAQGFSGKVAGHYEGIIAHYVKLGGDRQYDYKVTPVTGTATIITYIPGYWIEEDSQAVVAGGVGAVGQGTAFPVSPVTNDLFFRTDLYALFVWTGSAWVDSVGKTAGAAMWTQAGTAATTTSGSGENSNSTNVTFPVPFAVGTTPIVVLSTHNGNWSIGFAGSQANNGGFNATSRRVGQSGGTGIGFNWIAYGQRA